MDSANSTICHAHTLIYVILNFKSFARFRSVVGKDSVYDVNLGHRNYVWFEDP